MKHVSICIAACVPLAFTLGACDQRVTADRDAGRGDAGTIDASARDAGTAPDGSAADAGVDAHAPGCAAGRLLCGDTCIDPTNDPRHCGGCDEACESGGTCEEGACVSPEDCRTAGCTGFTYCDLATGACLPGCIRDEQCSGANERCDPSARDCTCVDLHHRCGGECVADASPATCGASCTPCPAPPNGSATCDGTSCDFACDAGFHRCGDACLSNLSVASCGASCTPCPAPANGSATCDGTSCGFDCDEGYHACGSACASNASLASCGASCTPCPVPANGTATCDGTACGITCDVGYSVCGTVCAGIPGSVSSTLVVAPDAGRLGHTTALARDAAGGLHLAFYSLVGTDLRYAYRAPGGAWTTPVVADGADGVTGWWPSIAVDAAGGVHVAHRGPVLGLRYSYRTPAGVWTTETARATGSGTDYEQALALDAAGGVHVAYTNGVDMAYSYRSPAGVWTHATIDASRGSFYGASIALDATGTIHVAYGFQYRSIGVSELRYATRSAGGAWTTIAADTGGYPGATPSLALDAAGGIHVGHYDRVNRDLRYSHRSPAGTWTSAAIDTAGVVGEDCSLGIDAEGAVHFVYTYRAFDGADPDLRYAYRSPAGVWTTTTADATGANGIYPSLAVDAGGVHVVYGDDTTGTSSSYGVRHAYLARCP